MDIIILIISCILWDVRISNNCSRTSFNTAIILPDYIYCVLFGCVVLMGEVFRGEFFRGGDGEGGANWRDEGMGSFYRLL